MLRHLITRAVGSAVVWGLIGVCFRLVSGVLILPLVLRYIPTEQLGIWYVFLSLGTFISMLDLGFTPTITRATSYAWGGATEILPTGIPSKPHQESTQHQPNLELLARLIVTSRVFYLCTALAATFLLLTAGTYWIWQKTSNIDSQFSVRLAWVFWCLGGLINGIGSLWPTLLSGVNGVRESQKIMALSLFVNSAVSIAGLLLGMGIWALVLAQFLMGLVLRYYGKKAFYKIAREALQIKAHFDWGIMKTFWPMSWRSSMVTIGAFLILQANTLICAQYLGLQSTAIYGLSLQVVTLLKYVSAIWLQVKMPLISQMRAQHRLQEIVSLFAARMRLALFVYLIGGCAIVLFGSQILLWIKANTELLPTPMFLLLMLICLLEMQASAYASLIETENENPFAIPVFLTGFGVILLSYLLTPTYGVLGILLSYLVPQSCFNLWWPLCRATQGLRIKQTDYWKLFFFQKRLF